MEEGLNITLKENILFQIKKNILFQWKDTTVTMSKFVTKNRIYANFIVLYLRTESRFEELFSVLSLFQDRLSATDVKSITI